MSEMVETPGGLPIYQQVTELLIRDIAANRLVDGERLPPEREMAARLGVAVGTLRKALAELQSRGLLERVQGSGNYIRAITDPQSVYTMFRLELIDGGGLPTAEILSVARMPKPDDLPRFSVSREAHCIRRLRRLSGQPAALEEIWLDVSYVDRLTADELSESLYLFYRNSLDLWIVRAEDKIGLGTVPAWTVDSFGPAPGAPVPLVERISQDRHGQKAEFSRSWYDPAIARYVVRLK